MMKRFGLGICLWLVCGAATALAATATWSSGWSGGGGAAGAPANGDDVVISSGNLTWDGSLPTNIASWLQEAGYADTVTFDIRFPGQGASTNLTITGDCVVSNGTWAHTANSGTETYRLHVSVGGAFELAAAALVHGDQRGFTSGTATGAHGGKNGRANGQTYGSIHSPTNLGLRGGGYAGGGAIRLDVGGAATVDGTISANGRNSTDHWQGGGAGGSVWLTTGTLVGNGTIRANGGSSGAGAAAGGGGGRVAVILAAGTTFGSVATTAYGGGNGWGAAGTVYLEKSTDTAGQGELVVDNNGNVPSTYGAVTDLNGSEAVTYEFARLTLTNAGVVGVGADDTLIVTNTVISADSDDGNEGIDIAGGALTTQDTFAFSNYFIRVSAAGSAFDPTNSLTVDTNAVFSADQPHALTGDLVLRSGAELTHAPNASTEAYKIDLTIGGDFTIHTGAVVDVDQRGYATGGPGGGAHGGERGNGGGTTYGSIHSPTNLGGNAGAWDGGGAVKLTVAGASTILGTISANGQNSGDHWQGGAPGGSVWLTTGTLAGNGLIRANGGNSGAGAASGGGGGRIAIVLTSGATFGGVTTTAYGGGNGWGGPGTVYRRTSSQAADEGVLVIANASAASAGHADISANVADARVAEARIEATGRLQVSAGQVLQVSRVWSNGNVFVADPGSTVQLVETNDATLYGDSAFASLVCTNLAKEIQFEAGSTIGVTEFATLLGPPATTNLRLRSTAPTTNWIFNVSASAVQDIRNVDAKNSDASPGSTVVALDSIDSGSNTNWWFGAAGATNVWIGPVSTNWGNGANWSLGRGPIAADDKIIISNTAAFYPSLPSAQTLNKLEILAGASLQLAGMDLTVEDAMTAAGALIASGSETVTLNGDADFTGGVFTGATSTVLLNGAGAQSVTPAGNRFHRLTVTNAGRTVTFVDAMYAEWLRSESVSLSFGGSVTAGEHRVYSDLGVATQTVAAGETFTVGDLVLLGATSNSIVLRSSSGGSAWNLNVTRCEHVRNVDVSDSDADGGLTIYAITSTDGGSNPNWIFNAEWRVWNGTVDSDFNNTNNWTPAGVIDGNSRILVDGDYASAPVVSAPTSVAYVNIGVGEQSSALTISDALTVGEDFKVMANGSVVADVPVVVSNDMLLATGASLTHTDNVSSEQFKIDFAIGGGLTIEVGALVSVDQRGYATGGPGGGAHGGESGNGGGTTYGSIHSPTSLGSNAGVWDGGGAVRFNVAGATALNGTVSANGQNSGDHWQGGAPGGSVWLTTGTLAGNGLIRANGGNSGAGAASGGGGGRIAIVLTSGATFGSVTTTAYGGGNGWGGPGTVYRRTSAQAEDEGVLFIENANAAGTAHAAISPNVSGTTVGELIITGAGQFQVDVDQQLRVSRVWSNAHDFVAETGAIVEFVETNTASIFGTTTFAALLCTNVGKRIEFATNSLTTITEYMTMYGEPTTNLLLRSMSDGVPWTLTLGDAVVDDNRYVDVMDSDASAGVTVGAVNSLDSGSNSNWVFGVAGATNTWIGVSNTVWGVSTNWSLGREPIPADDLTIISNGPFDPTLPSDRTLNKLQIDAGANVTLAGFDLMVNDWLSNAGTLTASNTETVTLVGDVDFTGGLFVRATSHVFLAGAAAQTFTPDDNSFYRLTLTNAGRTVTVTDGLDVEYLRSESVSATFGASVTAGEFRVYSDAAVVTQTFAFGWTFAVRDLVMKGGTSDSIVLRSSDSGFPWNLDVTRSEYVRNVDVKDSDASGGLTIYAVTSTDSGSNPNWVFNADRRVWNGSVNSDFGNTNNWTPTGAIGGASRLVIDGAYVNEPVVSSNIGVRSIMIGPGEDSSSLRISDTLVVGEDFNIFANGDVTADVPVTVSNNMTMVDGALLTHTVNGATEAYKVDFTIGGGLDIDAGAVVNVNQKGLTGGGPGSSSHGGQHGAGGGATYGSVTGPTRLGSPGGAGLVWSGGGAVRFNVAGATALDGIITADGRNSGDHNQRGGAGGSVWITSGTLSGNGVVTANGGQSGAGANAGGGGGRVSVDLASGGFDGVTLEAFGAPRAGTRSGGAGTVYKRSGALRQALIDNNGSAAGGDTHLPPSYDGSNPSFPFPDWEFTDDLSGVTVVVTNEADFALTTNLTVRSLVVATANEAFDLDDAEDQLKLRDMRINGTLYRAAGLYTVVDWNGFATPGNVSGLGSVLIGASGTVLFLR